MKMNKKSTSFSIADFYRKNPVIFFVGLVALQIILFYVLYRNPWVEQAIFTPLVNFYALVSGMFLSLIGYATEVSGDLIYSSQFSVSIKKGCDAAEPMAIFIAGIVAFPALIKKKFVGLGIGLFILFLLNVVRIATLYITGIHYPDFFESMHLAVWQVAFIFVAILLWFLWLKFVVGKAETK
jgi:exosortase H (IPTLxxWG-CTERM-specific)